MRKNVMTSFLVSSQRNHSLKYIYIYICQRSIPCIMEFYSIPEPLTAHLSRPVPRRPPESALRWSRFFLCGLPTPRLTHGPATFFCIICHLSVRHTDHYFFLLLDSTLTVCYRFFVIIFSIGPGGTQMLHVTVVSLALDQLIYPFVEYAFVP
jgi:hypothetical protein